jgi:hypothetical protein
MEPPYQTAARPKRRLFRGKCQVYHSIGPPTLQLQALGFGAEQDAVCLFKYSSPCTT